MIRRTSILLVALAALCLSQTVSALPYTVEAGVTFGSVGTVKGTLNQVFDLSGTPFATDGTVTNGTGGPLDQAGQDVLIFSITLDGDSAPMDAMGASGGFLVSLQGAGYFADAAVSPVGANSASAADVFAQLAPFHIGHFGFGFGVVNPANNLDPGESSVRMFLTFAAGAIPLGLSDPSFMISRAAGTDFSFTALEVPVPEPGTASLLGLGLIALGATRVRQTTRRQTVSS